jgi:NAD(P)-dependent dehydrogenase (short-subunit alcohol dehydrogenase family)
MPGRVEGKTAIVTGGTAGIGLGIAQLLAAEGAAVVVAGRSAEAGEAAAAGIRQVGGRATYCRTDVSREAECQALVETATREFGRLDILVNNAGIFPRATLEETTEVLWDRIHGINLKGAFFCCKHAAPAMRSAGGGAIINIGSANAYVGGGNLLAYSVSKGGLITMTRNLARALATDRIRVNYVSPGWVITETEIEVQAAEGHDEEWIAAAGKRLPLGRHQVPQDAAYAVLYLASDEASQVTGEMLNVDGGLTMR